jgi:hypothetical protein
MPNATNKVEKPHSAMPGSGPLPLEPDGREPDATRHAKRVSADRRAAGRPMRFDGPGSLASHCIVEIGTDEPGDGK